MTDLKQRMLIGLIGGVVGGVVGGAVGFGGALSLEVIKRYWDRPGELGRILITSHDYRTWFQLGGRTHTPRNEYREWLWSGALPETHDDPRDIVGFTRQFDVTLGAFPEQTQLQFYTSVGQLLWISVPEALVARGSDGTPFTDWDGSLERFDYTEKAIMLGRPPANDYALMVVIVWDDEEIPDDALAVTAFAGEQKTIATYDGEDGEVTNFPGPAVNRATRPIEEFLTPMLISTRLGAPRKVSVQPVIEAGLASPSISPTFFREYAVQLKSGRIAFPDDYVVAIETGVGWIENVRFGETALPTFLDGTSRIGGDWSASDGERRRSVSISLSGPPRGIAFHGRVLISGETAIPQDALTVHFLTTDFETAVEYRQPDGSLTPSYGFSESRRWGVTDTQTR